MVMRMTFEPDGFTGTLLAVEGIENAKAVLNGPTGCKLYHAYLSDCQYPRASSFDPLSFSDEFYFGQPRLPCTYLDEGDYVAGSAEKLKRILPSIPSLRGGPLVLVNSPGASLIGDDLERFIDEAGVSKHCLAIENANYSASLCKGFSDTVIRILEWLGLERQGPQPGKVNLIGISLYHSNWDSSVKELKSLLALLGLEVISVVCAGTSTEELFMSTSASCNIVVFHEYGLGIAQWYERHFSIPYVSSPEGAPVGFDATLAWIVQIADAMGLDASHAIAFLRQAKKEQYRKIARFHSLTGLPKGASFALKADASIALPLTKWLYNYLGMVPVCVDIPPNTNDRAMLSEFLDGTGFGGALSAFNSNEHADVVFADGHTVIIMQERKLCKAGIEISLPSSGYVDFLPRTYVGISGALFLLEEILNGLARKA